MAWGLTRWGCRSAVGSSQGKGAECKGAIRGRRCCDAGRRRIRVMRGWAGGWPSPAATSISCSTRRYLPRCVFTACLSPCHHAAIAHGPLEPQGKLSGHTQQGKHSIVETRLRISGWHPYRRHHRHRPGESQLRCSQEWQDTMNTMGGAHTHHGRGTHTPVK